MTGQPVPAQAAPDETKRVPQAPQVRRRIREAAAEVACGVPRDAAPSRDTLAELGEQVLQRLDLPREFLGFAMVAVSNGFWREQFEAVRPSRRLLLLPKCLRDPDACRGRFDSVGLHCAGCGACVIHDLVSRARDLGYEVVVAEGTSSVIMKVLDGEADAVLGVACLESLDESFEPIADLGVPNQAIPLLRDGCERTETEPGLILELLAASRSDASSATRSPVPLLREARRIFEREAMDAILRPHVTPQALELDAEGQTADPMLAVEAVGIDWLRCGGKRLRPFVTLAAWALGTHGVAALAPDAPTAELVTDPVRDLGVAIEALHKASLVHDDIADGDELRYGRPTLHRSHGVGPAVNVGDWLVGLGYRLIAARSGELGAEAVADILGRLSRAQLDLCRGQGAELEWMRRQPGALRPVDALAIAALKTAPAFEVALYAGLRASGAERDEELLGRFSNYLGEAYQVLNDLEDWRLDRRNKAALGQDVLAGRPTILRAFAIQAGGWERLSRVSEEDSAERIVAEVRALYEELGAFEKARVLVDRLKMRCGELADDARPDAIGELLRFLVRAILRERPAAQPGA
ncbi:MAG: polyprenyl synthetase family protein [Armatimonadota bacterium]|nr:polyprenyl synthetase family protein [Armatimonadota bacterium]